MTELTMSQAAELTKKITGQHIAEVSLRAAAERGALKAHRVGGKWVTTEKSLRAYLSNRPTHFRQAARTDTADTTGRDIRIIKKPKKSVKIRSRSS